MQLAQLIKESEAGHVVILGSDALAGIQAEAPGSGYALRWASAGKKIINGIEVEGDCGWYVEKLPEPEVPESEEAHVEADSSGTPSTT
jgi:hypothetical protein